MAIQFAPEAPPRAVVQVRSAVPPKDVPKRKHAGGRPKLDKPKAVLNIRIDADVLERWRASGKGWQARMNDVLAAAEI